MRKISKNSAIANNLSIVDVSELFSVDNVVETFGNGHYIRIIDNEYRYCIPCKPSPMPNIDPFSFSFEDMRIRLSFKLPQSKPKTWIKPDEWGQLPTQKLGTKNWDESETSFLEVLFHEMIERAFRPGQSFPALLQLREYLPTRTCFEHGEWTEKQFKGFARYVSGDSFFPTEELVAVKRTERDNNGNQVVEEYPLTIVFSEGFYWSQGLNFSQCEGRIFAHESRSDYYVDTSSFEDYPTKLFRAALELSKSADRRERLIGLCLDCLGQWISGSYARE